MKPIHLILASLLPVTTIVDLPGLQANSLATLMIAVPFFLVVVATTWKVQR